MFHSVFTSLYIINFKIKKNCHYLMKKTDIKKVVVTISHKIT